MRIDDSGRRLAARPGCRFGCSSDTVPASTDQSSSGAHLVDLLDSCSRSHGNPSIQKPFMAMRQIRRSFEGDGHMQDRTTIQSLLDPVDDISDFKLPPRFAQALAEVRAAIARCEKAGIPRDTMLAALMTELMPCLVEAYGPDGVATLLGQLAGEISTSGRPPSAIQ